MRKLSLKVAVSKKRKGQVTVWLVLTFLVFLSLYLICLQSVQKQSARRMAEQVTESSLFSLFSEYEPHLLENYDLFYLDTSFRSGKENRDELCSHLWKFTEDNLDLSRGGTVLNLQMKGIEVKDFVRATDGGGMVFYQQAVRVMKDQMGLSLVEDWILDEHFREELNENSKKFQEDCETYEDSVVDYEDEEEPLDREAYSWDGLWKQFAIDQVMVNPEAISEKVIDLTSVPSVRPLSEGVGAAEVAETGILEKQLFISYLQNHMADAVQREEGEPVIKSQYLDYQMEYLLWGKGSDLENLEQTLQSLLLMREGVNYVFLLTHEEYQEKAELLATLLAGITGNVGIIKSLKHVILLGWAYGESLVEVRQLLQGKEITLLKEADNWQVPLSGVLLLAGDVGRYDEQKIEQKGMNYESFLRLLLTMYPEESLAMRGLDVIEGELQQIDGCENIHVDHCIEKMTAQIWLEDVQLERSYQYQ